MVKNGAVMFDYERSVVTVVVGVAYSRENKVALKGVGGGRLGGVGIVW